ncbi:extracellular solute-binding protein [Streptomyces cocklensis]|uniref:Carbohydrate ABC transporter substrate-binding protein (CUT1 family) n=1 Tax=Actinacidiphila cocklensis TaxID=887465 RepID=A0A9W4E7P7_9ACTN|nr:extracellular solute-binding protein [Actinacidiphila cocklensis]MDD1064217.1 extracellular solute-binding protein [Actinacidiphila cocklensis]WSX75597.1 extracellular solute-binding protein [Streptomyces sp. NBC_00899]CAG6394718.1 Carbohydrate ABC transporter substrate-binding protein (CUT1 family) [Actinacidiphila cocklensis]
MRSNTRRLAAASLAAVTATALLTACGATSSGQGSGADGNTITLWTHNAGNAGEYKVVQQIVKDFNAGQSTYKVKIQAFPQQSYNDSVVAAASAKKLPCILDSDGPNVPNWAWGGYLAPVDLSGSQVPLSDQLPSTVGTYQGKTYTFGYYDVALTMFARKSVLQANSIRIPTIGKPWTKDEFDAALAKLKAGGKFTYPLEMGTGGAGEWWPYAYSPQLQSFGGDLVDRSQYKTADKAMNGPAAVAWGTWFRSLVTNGYMAQKSGASPNNDFLNGKSAIEWDGSWDAATNSAKLGSDLAVLPPVDFGKGPKIGGASWQWGMSATCSNKAGAQAYLKFSRQTKYFVDFAKAAGTIPATADAAAQIPGYQPGGPYDVFSQEARKFAVVRPVTPAYPFISSVFEKTAKDILAGADVQKSLDQAVQQINSNLKTNRYYAG